MFGLAVRPPLSPGGGWGGGGGGGGGGAIANPLPILHSPRIRAQVKVGGRGGGGRGGGAQVNRAVVKSVSRRAGTPSPRPRSCSGLTSAVCIGSAKALAHAYRDFSVKMREDEPVGLSQVDAYGRVPSAKW